MNWKRFKIGSLSLLLAASLLPQAALAQDTTIDRFLVNDQNYNFGRAASELDLGGSLGWGQSYYSESYVNMYEATGERFWLDKIVEHTDRMIGNARDHDGDGFAGWPDHRYAHKQIKNDQFAIPGAMVSGVERLTNGSFETDSNADGIPDNWTAQGASGKVYRSTASGDAFDGSAGVIIESDGTNPNRLVQTFTYEAGTTYLVEAFVGVESELTEAIVDVYNATAGTVLGTIRIHHVGFERYAFTFRAPGSGTLQLRLGLQDYNNSGYKARFDAVSIKPANATTLTPVPIDNGGFEDLDPLDPTMADGWTRWHASTSANIYISSDAYSGNNSLAVTTDNTSWEVAEQMIDYIPSYTYTLRYKGKALSTAASGRVSILNQTDSVTLGTSSFSSTSWGSYSVTFTAPPVPGKTVKIRLMQSNWQLVGFTSLFDDLELFVSPPSGELMINGIFETLDSGDATLPAGWTRAAGTTSADAYVSTGINNNFTGNRGLAIRASSSAAKSIEQTKIYAPGETYVMTLQARTTDPRYPATVDVYNATDSVVLASVSLTGTTWTRYPLMFTAPSVSGKTLKVRISRPASPGATISYVDVVSMQPLTKTDAAGWTRESTSLDSAHRVNETPVFADDWGLRLVHDGVSAPVITSPLHNYKPDTEYGISFSSKVSPGTVGRARVLDRTTSTTLGSWTFSGTAMLTGTFESFQTPAAAGNDVVVEFSIPSGSSGDTAWIDAVVSGEMFEHLVHEGVVGSAILRFVNTVYANSELHGDYLAKADAYRDFIADNLVRKWDPWWRQMSGVDGSNNGAGVYIFPVGFSTEWFPARSLPHNQYLALAELLYELHDATEGVPAYATERPYYWSRANDMVRAFQAEVRPHPLNATLGTDAYVWGYWDPMGPWDTGHYAVYTNEDLSHAAITMVGPRAAYDRGVLFTRDDMRKFTRTLVDVMWNQSLTEPVLAWQNSRQPVATVDQTRSNQFHKWTYFAEFDPTVRDIAIALCETIACTPVMASEAANWSRNKTINASFELVHPTDATLPEHWSRWQGTSATVYRTTADSAVSGASVAVETTGTAWQVLEQRLEDYEPNTDYTISFMGKRYGSVNGRVELYDYTTMSVLGSLNFSETSWTRKSFTVRTPANAGNNVRVRLYTQSYTIAGQKVGFDDVRAFPSLIGSQVANAGFETADRWDTTLPRYWKRGDTTSAANAVLDTADKQSGRSSLKLVSAAGAAQELSYDWKGYVPNGSYTVTFQGKASGAAGGKVAIIDTTTSTGLASAVISAAGWTASSMTFTAPAAHDRTLKVVITSNNPSVAGTAWVDELNVRSN